MVLGKQPTVSPLIDIKVAHSLTPGAGEREVSERVSCVVSDAGKWRSP